MVRLRVRPDSLAVRQCEGIKKHDLLLMLPARGSTAETRPSRCRLPCAGGSDGHLCPALWWGTALMVVPRRIGSSFRLAEVQLHILVQMLPSFGKLTSSRDAKQSGHHYSSTLCILCNIALRKALPDVSSCTTDRSSPLRSSLTCPALNLAVTRQLLHEDWEAQEARGKQVSMAGHNASSTQLVN